MHYLRRFTPNDVITPLIENISYKNHELELLFQTLYCH